MQFGIFILTELISTFNLSSLEIVSHDRDVMKEENVYEKRTQKDYSMSFKLSVEKEVETICYPDSRRIQAIERIAKSLHTPQMHDQREVKVKNLQKRRSLRPKAQ